VVVRLPWTVESIAHDPDGLAATVARGRDVWVVGRESGAVTLDVRGASDALRASLTVSIDLRAPWRTRGRTPPREPHLA
jgi:hypothetical protein